MTNHKSRLAALAIFGILLLMATSCVYERSSPASAPSTSAAAALEPVLNIYNWEDYLGATTISDFEGQTGIKLNVATFKSEPEMLSEVQSDPAKYDLFVASGFMVQEMRKLKLLAPLDKGAIPNLGNISQRFLSPPYDPQNAYCVPYLWGTTGIAVNTEYVPADEASWGILWDSDHQGKIAMLNEPQVVIGAVLKYLGYSLNEKDPEILVEAEAKLIEQKPLLDGYLDTLSIRDKLISGELWAAQIYSGDGLYAAEHNDAIKYVIPKEGAEVWVDNFCLPRDVQHKSQAEAFLDFMLRPEVSAAVVNDLYYATPNAASEDFINPEILADPSVYAGPELAERLELWGDIKERANRDNAIWAVLQR